MSSTLLPMASISYAISFYITCLFLPALNKVTFLFLESINHLHITTEGYHDCTNLCHLDPPSIFSPLPSINLIMWLPDGHPLVLRVIPYLSMHLWIIHAELWVMLRIPIYLWSLCQAARVTICLVSTPCLLWLVCSWNHLSWRGVKKGRQVLRSMERWFQGALVCSVQKSIALHASKKVLT